MKIAVDFVKAGQEWDPNTGNQRNYLLLAFGGKQFRVDVSEAEMERFISAAMNGREPSLASAYEHGADIQLDTESYIGPSDEQFLVGEVDESDMEPVEEVVYQRDEVADDGDFVFGGDVERTVDPPALFNTDDLPDPQDNRPPAPLSPVQKRLEQIKAQQGNRPAQQRKEEKMRRRAQQRPPRRVRTDEMGYPDPADVEAVSRRIPRQQPQGGPEVRETHVPDPLDGDEDGFEQG